jgi:hypothetical protein
VIWLYAVTGVLFLLLSVARRTCRHSLPHTSANSAVRRSDRSRHCAVFFFVFCVPSCLCAQYIGSDRLEAYSTVLASSARYTETDRYDRHNFTREFSA